MDPSTEARVAKAVADVSTISVTMLSEASLGLFRVHEHVQAKIPQLSKQMRELASLDHTIEASEQAIQHSRTALNDMQDLDSFEGMEKMGKKLKDLFDRKR